MVLVGVYIPPPPPPPEVNAAKAVNQLADQVLAVENANPDSVVIVVGDFNHTCLSKVLQRYKQHVDKRLDHCYTVYKGADHASVRAPLGKSDHNHVILTPAYRQHTIILSPAYTQHTVILTPAYTQHTVILTPAYTQHTVILIPAYKQKLKTANRWKGQWKSGVLRAQRHCAAALCARTGASLSTHVLISTNAQTVWQSM